MRFTLCVRFVCFALIVTLLHAPSARAQVDDAVRGKAAGLSVTSGTSKHDVAAEMAKLDALRTKALKAVADKTEAKDYDLGEELKALQKLDNYSSRLADLVAVQHPDSKEVVGWLQANAAVIGTWSEAYTTTSPFADNTRLAELAAIETRLGRKIGGAMQREINSLRATAESASASAGMEELGRRVRLASGLVSKERGIITLGLHAHPAVVTEGQRVGMNVAVAVGGERAAGPEAGSVTEQVTYDFGITGPKAFALNTLKKKYAPGAALSTEGYYTVDTKDLPAGLYTATISATDTYGHSLSAKDTFEVREKPAIAAAPAGPISPALAAAFDKLAKGIGKPTMKIWASFNDGSPPTTCGWQDDYAEGKGNGGMSVTALKGWKEAWQNDQNNPSYVKSAMNGKLALIKRSDPDSPCRVDIYWVNEGRYCYAFIGAYGKPSADVLAACEKRALEMAKSLDDVIVSTDKGGN